MNNSTIEVITEEAPSYWAPYLINGDHSGMEQSEIEQCDKWLKWTGGRVTDCSEESFFGTFEGMGHDLCEYTIILNEVSS